MSKGNLRQKHCPIFPRSTDHAVGRFPAALNPFWIKSCCSFASPSPGTYGCWYLGVDRSGPTLPSIGSLAPLPPASIWRKIVAGCDSWLHSDARNLGDVFPAFSSTLILSSHKAYSMMQTHADFGWRSYLQRRTAISHRPVSAIWLLTSRFTATQAVSTRTINKPPSDSSVIVPDILGASSIFHRIWVSGQVPALSYTFLLSQLGHPQPAAQCVQVVWIRLLFALILFRWSMKWIIVLLSWQWSICHWIEYEKTIRLVRVNGVWVDCAWAKSRPDSSVWGVNRPSRR